MAKKISAEKFEVDSKDMELSGGKLMFNSILQADEDDIDSLDTVVLAENTARGTAVDSVDTRVALETSIRGSKVTSMDTLVLAENTARGTAVDSLDTRVALETSIRGSKVTSMDTLVLAENTNRGVALSSIDTRIDAEEKTTQIMRDQTLSSGAGHHTVDFTSLGYETLSEPVIWGQMRSTVSSDPIVLAMLSGDAHHNSCTFLFSDDLPSANYKLDIIFTR
jgi:hypothetical protein